VFGGRLLRPVGNLTIYTFCGVLGDGFGEGRRFVRHGFARVDKLRTPLTNQFETPMCFSSLSFRTLVAVACVAAAPLYATQAFADSARMDKVLAGEHRSEANKARDKYRNPKATLEFFGVKPNSNVVEVLPGGGWYTEVLAPYLRESGTYVALWPATAERGIKSHEERMAAKPALYDKAKLAKITASPNAGFVPTVEGVAPGSADFVLTFRNIHNLINPDLVDVYMRAFFDMLKPGGVLGVVDHRAKPGSTLKVMIDSGYVTEEYTIKRALAAGFRLDAKSDVNNNAKDAKDYPNGVWTLPPTLTEGEKDRAKYLEIGESDRFTIRFVKPAK
jgi:predicted methyltransferase